MRIFLRGGRFDGTYDTTGESDRGFAKERQAYRIAEEITADGAVIFELDAIATANHRAAHLCGYGLPSREAAIADANKKLQAKFGNEVQFPDGDQGHLVPGSLSASWSFRVVDQYGERLVQYTVYPKGEQFAWTELAA
jgi:hypothetical protein